jgi:hypothetical protein
MVPAKGGYKNEWFRRREATKMNGSGEIPIPCHPEPIPCHPDPIPCHPDPIPCHPDPIPCHPDLIP